MCPTKEIFVDTYTRTELTKPNELLVMVPVVGKLSPVSRKLFNALLLNGGDVYRQRLQSGAPMLAEETFEARLSDLVAHLPGDASDWSSNASAHLREMMHTKVAWHSIDRNSDTSELGEMNLLSQASIIKKGRALHVSWAFPPRVLVALNDPAYFTRLDLEVIGSLRTYASIALYEICSRYKTNPSGLTCSQPPDWWVEALTARSLAAAPPKAKGKWATTDEPEPKPRREWRKVKSESVLDAVDEINAKTDLEIELIEKRTGKAVSAVQFAVRRKRKELPGIPLGAPPEVLERAVRLGISASDISTIMRSARGGAEIVKAAITKLEERAAREDLQPLGSTLAYLKKILGDLDQFVDTSGEQASQSRNDIMSQNKMRRTPAPAADVEDAKETPESLAKRQIEALSRPEQEALAATAINSMRHKGIATAAVLQAYARYQAGSPLAGVILGQMIREYQGAKSVSVELP